MTAGGSLSYGPDTVGPAGEPLTSEHCQDTIAAGWVFLAPGLDCYALLASIGDGAPFVVGAAKTFAAATSGPLRVGFNDSVDGVSDNTGGFTVTVRTSLP